MKTLNFVTLNEMTIFELLDLEYTLSAGELPLHPSSNMMLLRSVIAIKTKAMKS